MHFPGGPDSMSQWLAESQILHSVSNVPIQLSKSPSF